MDILAISAKAFAVAVGIVAGVCVAPVVAVILLFSVLSCLYGAAVIGDWIQDKWRRR